MLLIVFFGVFLMPTSTLHVVTIQEKILVLKMSSKTGMKDCCSKDSKAKKNNGLTENADTPCVALRL
jgi:hypothetical protein